MKESQKERYLGDQINNKGTIKDTVLERTNKGYAIVSQIMALLKELPIGQLRTQIGLILRDAWFVNGTLHNSEAWHGITKNTLKPLEAVDHHLLRQLLGAHSKTPLEFLYLETGCMPITFTIMSRRLIYLKEILSRPKEELVSRIYHSQKKSLKPGDWCDLVKSDLNLLGIQMTDESISLMGKSIYKKYIKSKIQKAAFESLNATLETHTKVKHIKYENNGKPQSYLTDKHFSNTECQVLTMLRSQTVRGIRMNFRGMFGDTLCPLCKTNSDTQEHISKCHEILKIAPNVSDAKFSDVFSNVTKQKEVVRKYLVALKIRDSLLGDESQHSLPGLFNTGPTLARTDRTGHGRGDRQPYNCTVSRD